MDNTLMKLPEPIRQLIDAVVASGEYRSPAEYISQLVRDAQSRAARDRLKAKVLENLQDGESTEMTTEDWAEIRNDLRAKYGPKDVVQ